MSKSAILRLIGKSERKVVAVFGISPGASHRAVTHVHEGAPGVPIWLFSTAPPLDETAGLCERIYVRPGAMTLLLWAERELWPVWVALAVAPWTGEHGRWPVKIAPFVIPPFRSLFLNDHGDLLSGTPGAICRHAWHRFADAARRFGNAAVLAAIHLSDVPRKVWVRSADVAGAWWLTVWAWLLRLTGYPQHRWFQRLHGNERLETAEPAGVAGGAVEYVQQHAAWKGEEIRRLAESSGARWLIWRRRGTEEPVDDVWPLFEDGRTFAVSRQGNFRAWKTGLFPMAPFRTLQQGEACRVLAPLAETIVADMAKLRALGIPRRGLAGTAWLELFWKAAAAGWNCYSVGQSRKLAPQPDLPMETADFFWRALRERQLRRLGPREADLSRGTISFAPALRPREAVSGKPRVLVVSPFLPYPLSHGGAVRIYNLCRALSDRVDFILAAMREQQDVVDYGRLHTIFRDVRVVDRDEPPSGEERLPKQVRQYQSRSLRALIGEMAAEWQPDAMQIEYTHMADFRSSAPDVPAVLVEHDLTFTLYRQLLETRRDAEAQREFERWHEFERRWLAGFDGVWTVSEDDRAIAIGAGSRPEGTFVVANGVDLARFQPRPGQAAAPEILYVGSFRHLPNIIGFEKLRRDVMPRVWERFPQLRLRVVAGPEHEKFWRDLGGRRGLKDVDGRIAIHGFVEDLTPLYADATAVVVPLEVSAGTNIKVLEAMACGKAIVTTTVGCAGLGLRDGRDVLIRDDWAPFAAAVCDVMAWAESRERLGGQARRAAEERFGWTAIAETALESYRRLAARKAPGSPG